jgi:hypothetical protein
MTSADHTRIDRLIAMASRLIQALESDIESLKSGNLRGLRMIEPETQKLLAVYGREAMGFNPQSAGGAPPELRKLLLDTTRRFRELLAAQSRILTRLRNASEGMVRAVVEEIERERASTKIYAPKTAPASRANDSMLFNSVI